MNAIEFLDHQEARARSALKASAQSMKQEITQAASFEGIVRRHPYISLGVGATAGFLVGNVIVSRGGRSLVATAASLASPIAPLIQAAGRVAFKMLLRSV